METKYQSGFSLAFHPLHYFIVPRIDEGSPPRWHIPEIDYIERNEFHVYFAWYNEEVSCDLQALLKTLRRVIASSGFHERLSMLDDIHML